MHDDYYPSFIEGFNGIFEVSSRPEMLELFPVSTGSSFGSNPRVAENKITLPFAIRQTDQDSRYFLGRTFVICFSFGILHSRASLDAGQG